MGFLAIAYIIISCHSPFPATVAAYFMLGFGMALSIVLNNVFSANLANSTTVLGCFSGAYGLGGVISPLFATAMVSSGVHWSLFYTITLAVCVINLLFSGWAFSKFEEQTAGASQTHVQSTEASGATSNNESPGRLDVLKMSLKNRTTILGSLSIFAYQGAEVSVSGWVVSFLLIYRDGDPSRVGYVSAGSGLFSRSSQGLLPSQSAGTLVLQPICRGWYGAMAASWMDLTRNLANSADNVKKEHHLRSSDGVDTGRG